jgi:hypothetical protein
VLPKSLSASALNVAISCPSRYYAENIQRGADIQGDAANLGIALHAALEKFILGIKIRKDLKWDLEVLLALYDLTYSEVIGPDRSRPEYRDGRQLLTNWFHRDYIFDDIFGAKTLSVESKNSFPVRVEHNGRVVEVPFNYIFDRLDKISDDEMRVVDYKSGRFAISADDLRENVQARAYAVAVATKYPQVKKIWVEFDFLRHEKIGVVFTREDNIATYRFIQRALRDILDMDETKELPEVLNPECGWCVRKATCSQLASNVNVGGIMSLDIDTQALKFRDVTSQLKALTVLKNDLEKALILAANQQDTYEIDTERTRIRIGANMRRQIDQDAAKKILGDNIYSQYRGGIKLQDLDDIENRVDLTSGQKAAIKTTVTRAAGNPSVKVVKKSEEVR